MEVIISEMAQCEYCQKTASCIAEIRYLQNSPITTNLQIARVCKDCADKWKVRAKEWGVG